MKRLIILIATSLLITVGVSAQKNSLSEVKIKTSAVCDMCKERIENGLFSQKGVVEAKLDVATKILTIKFKGTKTSEDTLRKYISSLGYDADTILANKEAYNNLPGCCQAGGMD